MSKSQTRSFRQRIRHSRAFIFALIAITIVWVVSSMSERKAYRESYNLIFDGIDTAKYAVTSIDSTIVLELTSNGFYAFRRGIRQNHDVHISVASKIGSNKNAIQLTLKTDDYSELIRSQLDMRGVSDFKIVDDILTITLAKRECKAFVPKIDDVDFQFEGMVGLCGEPQVSPDTVYLYGSSESLAKIDAIYAAQQTLPHIRLSGKYRVKLRPDWQKYPDLRISTQSIDIFVPVEVFTEKAVTVPVEYTVNDNIKRLQLFPSSVTVNCLVPRKDYAAIQAEDFCVLATIDNDSSNYIQPVVTRFPANVRIKSITPSQIQYIIIK